VEEPSADEVADQSEPVFPEPRNESPSAPFIMPGVPRVRKKRSVVRVLVGTALGALVGLSLGYFILLYVLGPEGDLLQIAKYVPSAILPKSFDKSTSIADASLPPATAPGSAATAVDLAADETPTTEESATNVPAGYVEETPADSGELATGESDVDDRYGTEPAPLEEPAAEPIAEETSAAAAPALPLGGPTFSVDQLAAALEAGKAAQPGLVNGDLSDGAVRKTKGASYETLGELAEALTFVDRSSPSAESDDATSGANQLFAEIFSNPHTRTEIARIVSIWVSSPHRSNSGVFFAGTASGGQIAGDVYEYEVATEEGSKFTLLAAEPIEPSGEDSDRPVGIVGAIVDDPAENISGYSGTAERAIWLTRAIPLE
jgi:hypothetical protein